MVLWLAVEGADVSVLVRYTGYVDATITRWLSRVGQHSQRLHHDQLFNHLKLPYLQVDELQHAPVAGNRRQSWLWVPIEPVTKIIPSLYLGGRRKMPTGLHQAVFLPSRVTGCGATSMP